ncbi:MAG TPA: isochorismatase family cysteine hydrolase [Candidatus Binatia bacterium]|nr:isochorismatase family cysteine hydrolase [Candidatus Binatia bacterium]
MHKENYFTAATMATAARAMAGELPVNRRAAPFAPAVSALLVVDMQRYFLCSDSHAHIPAAAAIIPNINALIASFKKASRPVFFTRHGNDQQHNGQMAAWWGELLTRDHPLGSLDAGLDSAGQPVIEKTQYDAFFNTDLEARLRQLGSQQLVITGVTTHLCCETTARSAFMRGFAVFIAIDATATWNRELHFASLRGLAHGCAVPLLTAALTDPAQKPS